MRLLLDTHILLWAITASDAMPPRARSLLADQANYPVASVISIWEIAIKHQRRRGRPDDMPISGRHALTILADAGCDVLAVTGSHAASVDEIPPHHGDPFDRFLVAQARSESMHLLTHDKRLATYGDFILVV